MQFRHEIPEFLHPQVLYCDHLTQRHGGRNERSSLVFAKNLKMYEFRKKQLLHCVDLSGTTLASIKHQIGQYKGPRSRWLSGEDTRAAVEMSPLKISFGKFEYRNVEVKRVYILLHCGDKLLVLRRPTNEKAATKTGAAGSSSYQLTAQYEQVVGYRLVNSTTMKYQAMLELEFADGAKRSLVDFNNNKEDDNKPNDPCDRVGHAQWHQQLERLRSTQAELHIHRTNTQREFERLRNVLAFGRNAWRSGQLEEKQMLARCGDIWLRITAQDQLVIGIPLVNNCSPPNLTILRNVRPLVRCEGPVHYHYRLFQLRQRFEDLDSVHTFFQCHHIDEQQTPLPLQNEDMPMNWSAADTPHLLPDSFALLLMRLPISQVLLCERFALLLCYEIERQRRDEKQPPETGELQISLNFNVDFSHILTMRSAMEVSFLPATLHQDFLAIAFTSRETTLLLDFSSDESAQSFREMLVKLCHFKLLQETEDANKTSCSTLAMEVDGVEEAEMGDRQAPPSLGQNVFYNENRASLWYGCLIVEMPVKAQDGSERVTTKWQFYTPNEEKMCLLLRLLFNELLLLGCNVNAIECPSNYSPRNDLNCVKLIEFEDALRQELQKAMELLNNGTHTTSDCEVMARLTMRTDCMASAASNLAKPS